MGSLTLTLLHPLAACVHRFVDAEYHRTGFTLASGNDDKVRRKRGATESATSLCLLTPRALHDHSCTTLCCASPKPPCRGCALA